MHNTWLIVMSLTVFGSIAYLSFESAPLMASDQPRIISPHDPPTLPPGPGRQQFVTNCVACHSARYVTMQPPFPRKVWKAEVTKMVTAYGAPISEGDQTQIVDYLTAAFGVEDEKK